jgi:hypothetical protein
MVLQVFLALKGRRAGQGEMVCLDQMDYWVLEERWVWME